MRSYNPVTRGHTGQIKKAVELMLKARRPLFFTGGGVVSGRASEALTDLVRRLNFPITTSLMGIGAYPQGDRQCLGWPGMHGSYESNNAMHHTDLIICIGARFDDRVTNNTSKFCPTAKIIHVDIHPSSVSKTVRADVPIVGPADAVINEMISLVQGLPGWVHGRAVTHAQTVALKIYVAPSPMLEGRVRMTRMRTGPLGNQTLTPWMQSRWDGDLAYVETLWYGRGYDTDEEDWRWEEDLSNGVFA